MRFASIITLALLAISIGCSSPQKATFDVSVRNATDGPITVGFVKKGTPFERKWASPEDLTNLPPSRQPTDWGNLIPPGKIASVSITGQFDRGSQPFLRIYDGDHPMSVLLAMSRGLGDRLDLSIQAGHNNDFVVSDRGGKIYAKLTRLEPRPLPSTP